MVNGIFERLEDGGEIGWSGVYFPLHTGETPSRSTEKQSEQPTVPQRLWRQESKKNRRNWKKQTVGGLLQDKSVPGTSAGTRATAAPGLCLLGQTQDSWERAELMTASPAKEGLGRTKRDLVVWSRREGNKDEVVNTQRLWAPAGESWELGRVGPWPRQSLV